VREFFLSGFSDDIDISKFFTNYISFLAMSAPSVSLFHDDAHIAKTLAATQTALNNL
jgi:hypothetical protein